MNSNGNNRLGLSPNQRFWLGVIAMVFLGSYVMRSIMALPLVSFVIGAAVVLLVVTAVITVGAILLVPHRVQPRAILIAELLGSIVSTYRRERDKEAK